MHTISSVWLICQARRRALDRDVGQIVGAGPGERLRRRALSSPAELGREGAGEWTIGRENVVLGQAGGSISYWFHARDAHLVLSAEARAPIPFRVLLDGEAPGPSAGVDVDEDGTGVLREGRLYQLIRQHDTVHEQTLEITFLERGAEAYVFTFG